MGRVDCLMQSKRWSLIEAVTNTGVGWCINYLANLLVLNALGLHVSPGKALSISVIFTLISVVRSYTLRRIFNRSKHA